MPRDEATLLDIVAAGRRILEFKAGMIHGYDDVDLAEVWKTSERDVPFLIAGVERLLSQM